MAVYTVKFTSGKGKVKGERLFNSSGNSLRSLTCRVINVTVKHRGKTGNPKNRKGVETVKGQKGKKQKDKEKQKKKKQQKKKQ